MDVPGLVVATPENTPWVKSARELQERKRAAQAEGDAARGRPPKASDIPDVRLLAILNDSHYVEHLDPERVNLHGPDRWHNTYCLEERLLEFPYKVVLAKCASLIRRGLMDGCACGCRGDFELTEKGRAFLAERTISATAQAPRLAVAPHG